MSGREGSLSRRRFWKINYFIWGLKAEGVVVVQMCAGREFQTRGVRHWKDLWSKVFVLTLGTVRSFWEKTMVDKCWAEMKDIVEESCWNNGKPEWQAFILIYVFYYISHKCQSIVLWWNVGIMIALLWFKLYTCLFIGSPWWCLPIFQVLEC